MATALSRLHGERVLWIGQDATCANQLKRRLIKAPVFLSTHPLRAGGPHPLTADGPHPLVAQGDADEHLCGVQSLMDQLPFQTNSIDGVVLHHSLEEHTDPRLVLREVFRVLAPGGRLIVAGFNPWSLIGLRRAYARYFTDVMSQQRLVNPIRLFDWFTLLGFELDAPPLYAGLNLFFNRSGELNTQPGHQLPFGGLLVTSAVKQVNNYHFRMQRKVSSPRLAPVAYPHIASWTERNFHAADEQDENG